MVGFKIEGWAIYPIGSMKTLRSFFDTIIHFYGQDDLVHMSKSLYMGNLPYSDAQQAPVELDKIKPFFKSQPADAYVWNINDLKEKPDEQHSLNFNAENLYGVFMTYDNRFIFDVLRKALEDAAYMKTDVVIEDLVL